MKAILDTSVLLGPAPPPLVEDVAISVASLAELHFGVLVTGSLEVRAERLRRLALIEQTFSALPIDGAVARSYGLLAATVAQYGRQSRRRVFDLLIAATAVAHGARLYTRNAADLAGLESDIDIVDLASVERTSSN